ncbi:MAG: hypothetical protein POELPBGB_01374 [Bacteroidia bacterium]|nr:hypothetical protein [Bacteroidia bacterium]
MLSSAIILIFISAILHVSWNILLQSADDPLDVSTKAIGIGVILFIPLIMTYWIVEQMPPISSTAIFYGMLSGIAELGYFFFLSHSYRHGELSVVYPIARGIAPVLSFFFGILLLKENVTLYQVAGILLLIFGIWFVRRARLEGKKGFIPALLTGVFIASYTIIDKIGLEYTNPIYFGALKYFFTALCLIGFIPIRRYFIMYTGREINPKKGSFAKTAIIGIFIIATYQLVLFSLSIAPVALISPLRESAAVLISVWGIWKLKERKGLSFKIAGITMIFIGILLVAF